MFQQLLGFRAQTYIRNIISGQFRARSPERDAETDAGRISAIMRSIDYALRGAETEQAGLNRRVDDVLSRAAITAGNGDDEYLTREKIDSDHLDLFEKDIENGQRRLRELDVSIEKYKTLKAAVQDCFPAHGARRSTDRIN